MDEVFRWSDEPGWEANVMSGVESSAGCSRVSTGRFATFEDDGGAEEMLEVDKVDGIKGSTAGEETTGRGACSRVGVGCTPKIDGSWSGYSLLSVA